MSPCSRYREDLALLAGGDLPPGAERSAAEEHAQVCPDCAGLLEGLGADLDMVSRAAVQPEPDLAAASLVAPVLAHAAAEAVAAGLFRPPVAHRRTDLGLLAFGRVAAVVALVAASAVLGVAMLAHDESRRGGAIAQADPDAPATPAFGRDVTPATRVGQAAPDAESAATTGRAASSDGAASRTASADRPVRVHRAGGGPAVAIEWDSDGRESRGVAQGSRRGEAAGAYKVLASASAKDFSGAEPVLVAGRSLVASGNLPSMRTPDRSLTFFRVE